MKRKLIITSCICLLASIIIIWAGCIIEKPNACDCAFNESYQGSGHFDEQLSRKCYRFEESLNNTDQRVWESEKQNCLAAAGK